MSIIVKGGGGGENLAEEIALNRQKIETAIENLAGKKTGADITPEDVLKGKKGYKGQELITGTFDKDAFAEANKNGQYVWGKYEKTGKDVYINATITKTSNPVELTLTGKGVDYTQITASFFIGKAFPTMNGGTLKFTGTNSVESQPTPTGSIYKGTFTYASMSKESGKITINYSGISSDTTKYDTLVVSREAKTLLSYTVSDSETAHPDGGEKDGFWWERVKGSKYGMFVDETNETGYPTKVRILLPKIGPSYFRVSSNSNMFMMCYSIKNLDLEASRIGELAFSRTFRFTELDKLKIKCELIDYNVFEYMGSNKNAATKVFLSDRITTISAHSYTSSPFFNSSPNIKLYCEAPLKPTGWDTYWNYIASGSALTTMWGVTESQFDAL